MSIFVVPIGFVVLFDLFYLSQAITHWIVTEEGRIQAQHNSIYRLKRPYDLVAFLNQEKLAKNVADNFDIMLEKKAEMDKKWSLISSAAEVEQQLVSSDEDCIQAKNSDEVDDLFMNIIDYASDEFSYKDSFPDDKSTKGNINLDCTKFSNLDFSMATFPHLQVLKQPWNLTWPKETEVNLPLSSREIQYGLSMNKTSWYLYNLASLYWRSVGKIQKSIDCVKRAIHFAPRKYKDTPMFNLGMMLHRAQCCAEAAIVLHSSVDHARKKPKGHFVLANVYAFLGDYNRSVAFYNNALRLDPSWNLAQSMKHSVLCHSKVKKSLQDLKSSVHDVLRQLQEFQTIQEEWLRNHEELIRQLAPSTNRSLSIMFTAKSDSRMRESCVTRKKNGDEILSCDLAPDFDLNRFEMSADLLSLQSVLNKVKSQAKKINEQMEKPTVDIQESLDEDEDELVYDSNDFMSVDWASQSDDLTVFNTDDY